jgi:hypothetical protein
VEGWLSSQNSNTFPYDFIFNALLYKGLYICDRYFQVTRGLRARTVAVNAFQVALVGYVDLSIFAAWQKLSAETFKYKRLGANKLVSIQE